MTSRIAALAAALTCASVLVWSGTRVQLDKARALQQEGRYLEAIAALESVHGERDVESASLLAWLYGQTDQSERAIEEYRRLVRRHPEQVDFHNNLGALLFRARRFDEAKTSFEAASALSPREARPFFNLGIVSLETGEFLAAVAALERACELEPRHAIYKLTLARAHRAAFQLDEAVEMFRTGLGLGPPPAAARAARLELALALKHRGDYYESEKVLDAVLAKRPEDVEALFQLARLHHAMNRHEEAESELDRLVVASPRQAPAWFMRGLVSFQQNESVKARESFETLLSLAPGHAEGWYYLGLVLAGSGDPAGARKAFERALSIEPEHVGATYNLALLLRNAGEKEASQRELAKFQEMSERRERLDFLEERVRLNPGNARYFFELGEEYARSGRSEDAKRAYVRALELSPDFAEADVALAELSSSQRSR